MTPARSKNIIHQSVSMFASSVVGAKIFSVIAPPLDQLVVKWSGGKSSESQILSRVPIFVLTATGAKSGLARKTTLFGVPDGDKVVLIASNWGKSSYPSWYHNLKANPEASLTFHGETTKYIAHEARGEEREDGWEGAISLYKGYGNYAQRTGERVIPVMIMTPLKF